MNKSRQKELTRWLKQQSVISQRWLNISRLLGFVSGILIIAQAWFMARILQHMIMENIPREALLLPFTLLVLTFVLRAWVVWLRERVGYHAGQHIRFAIRRQVLDRLQQAGPAWIQGKPAGSWATLVLEQIDDMHDYYARYLPQMALAVSVPLLIVVAIFPSNWAAALILLGTAPLIPLFMALVGMGAADANRRNFLALARLSGHFLDRLRGMETLRIFGRGEAEIESIRSASEDFRQRTMEVLRLAFLSSGILEFFTSLSIALVAVYFGFSYLGELDFGHYDTGVTLAAGRYLVTFVSDANVAAAGTLGAALELGGAALPYAVTAETQGAAGADRITLTAIVTPTTAQPLTVINSSGSSNTYTNSTLTIVKLA